jgi:hypothetical protein
MNQPQIHGKQPPLKEVFSDDFFLRVPPYQRPYSWTVARLKELWDLSTVSSGHGSPMAAFD